MMTCSYFRTNLQPGNADGGLTIADCDIALDEEIEQFAVLPHFGEAQLEPAVRRSNADGGGSGWRRER